MDELSDDLLLLAVRDDGALALPASLRFGLAGSELVRLAAAGHVDIVRKRIVVLNPGPAGDPLLDEALASMGGRRREPTAQSWVARDRRGLVDRYLARAQDAGTVLAEPGTRLGLFPVTRWRVTDAGRAARARARLEAVAASAG
ncbi:MAG TPA: GPP34 family phosphoprotein, partial [Trebonia sp.]